MKKHFLLYAFLLLLIVSSKGQNKWEVQLYLANPMKDNINLGWFNIDWESRDDHQLYHKSYGTGICFQYNYDKNYSVRFRTGISRTNILEFNTIFESSNHGKQDIFHFAPSIVYNFRNRKLNAYLGFDGQYNIHSRFVSDAIEFGNKYRIEISGGFSTGIGALSGFQFLIGKKFFLGSEINPYLLYSNTGNQSRLYDGNNSLTNITKDKDFGITRFGLRFSIFAGIKFGTRKEVFCPD